MNKFTLALGIAISIAALLVSLNTTPNVVKAYSCSSSTSTTNGNHGSSSVSGSSGSCATTASSSSHAQPPLGGGNCCVGPPPNAHEGFSRNFPGASNSVSIGGAQSHCIATSAGNNGGLINGDSQQGSCSAHSP